MISLVGATNEWRSFFLILYKSFKQQIAAFLSGEF